MRIRAVILMVIGALALVAPLLIAINHIRVEYLGFAPHDYLYVFFPIFQIVATGPILLFVLLYDSILTKPWLPLALIGIICITIAIKKI